MLLAGNFIFAQPTPTNEWVNFYSINTTFDGSAVPVGAVVKAYDPAGVWCGSFTIATAGQYGFLLVYRDDATTPNVDEGAEPGDTIKFYINGHLALSIGSGNSLWTANGDIVELDLEGHLNYDPAIITIADTTATEDSLYSYQIRATDVDSDSLIYSLSSAPSWLSIDSVSGIISGTPTNDNVGDTVVTVIVNDGHGGQGTQTYSLQVLNTNDPPVMLTTVLSDATEDSAYFDTLLVNDVDAGDTLMFSLIVSPSWLNIGISSGILHGTPTNDDVGTGIQITAKVSDLAGVSDTLTTYINVYNTNDAPVIDTIADQSIGINEVFHLKLNGTDVDSDTLTFTAFSDTSAVVVSVSGDSLQAAPATGYIGTSKISVTVTDGTLFDTTSFLLTVKENSRPEISTIEDVDVNEDSFAEVILQGDDADGDSLIYTAFSDTAAVVTIISTDTLKLEPQTDWYGIANMLVFISDGKLADSTSFKLTVLPVNDAPVIDTIADQNIGMDAVLSLKLNGTDVDGDSLTFAAYADTPAVVVSVSEDSLKVAPATGYIGTSKISVTVTDGALFDTTSFNLTVINDKYISVYPGDTDNNGVVNELDILPVGVYFLKTTKPRGASTFEWKEQRAESFEDNAIAFADANGDGIVNEIDIVGIGVNWGSTHTISSAKYVININDASILFQHEDAFKKIYHSLSGTSEPVQQMRNLLEKTFDISIPLTFKLNQNFPNPFNVSTTIMFELPEPQLVTLKVFNLLGQERIVVFNDQYFTNGKHRVELDASNLSSGIYYYMLKTEKWQKIRKMVLIK